MFTRALTLIALAAITLPLLAADDGPTYLTPAEAGPDYVIQGEYLGELDADNGRGQWGVKSSPWAKASSRSWATKADFPEKAGSEPIAARWPMARRRAASLDFRRTNGRPRSRTACSPCHGQW